MEDFSVYGCDAILSHAYVITYDSQNAESRFILNSGTCTLHCAMSCPIQPYTRCYLLSEPTIHATLGSVISCKVPPSLCSVFRITPMQNLNFFVHGCMITPHFSSDDLGKNS